MASQHGPHGLTEEQQELLDSMFDLARDGEAEKLLALIDQGIPADLSNEQSDTLLILAAYNQHPDLVRALLERGAEANQVNDRGQTALGCAVFRQNKEITELLLDAGADPQLGEQSALAVVDMFGLEPMRALLDKHMTESKG
ncbi:ankyrin repeat domain-containing protein [Nesterenkonia ebinurensis]|uniref:ankyrin repeat domain-containing protein n=1 Tax=Nesterenkonia ebinurensis TaxID=2608252 RepID=UPI00168B21AD|nr:ankyrin repeat domain-containing protein [Nesterenkonia ebinurensis]